MRNGKRIIDKFVEHTSQYIILKSVKIWVGDIRAFVIYRQQV